MGETGSSWFWYLLWVSRVERRDLKECEESLTSEDLQPWCQHSLDAGMKG